MEKKIDAVAMTRRIREANFERLEGASDEERIRFYRDGARRLHEQIAREIPSEHGRSAPPR
ncbi:MAG TPA: hypothetical protein VK420_10900 [Longimicrobium sp.]|jgi:hypothetical protein|nr:hypothetical protein [Longimicrobium sp.]